MVWSQRPWPIALPSAVYPYYSTSAHHLMKCLYAHLLIVQKFTIDLQIKSTMNPMCNINVKVCSCWGSCVSLIIIIVSVSVLRMKLQGLDCIPSVMDWLWCICFHILDFIIFALIVKYTVSFYWSLLGKASCSPENYPVSQLMCNGDYVMNGCVCKTVWTSYYGVFMFLMLLITNWCIYITFWFILCVNIT